MVDFGRQSFWLMAGFVLLSIQSAGAAEPPKLFVVQDDSTIEKRIAVYLRQEKELKLELKDFKEGVDDKFVRLSFTVDPVPDVIVSIDSIPSAESEGKTTERLIRVSSYFIYRITPDHPKRSVMMEILNDFMRENWVPDRVYLDSDGDLRMETNVNIPGADYPLHPEMVYDAVGRLVLAWKQLYPLIDAAGITRK